MFLRVYWALAALLLLPALVVAADDPAQKSALDLLPASTVAYVEVDAPQKLIDAALDHPLMKELQQHPDYQQALQSPDMEELLKVVKLVEEKLGLPWREALTKLSGDGVYVGFDLATQGVIVLVHSRDAELLIKSRDTFLELARADAKERGKADPVSVEEYRSTNIYKLKDSSFTTLGPWLIITSKPLLGRMVLDNAAGAGSGSLATETQFVAAQKSKVGAPCVWSYTDLTILRATGLAKALVNKKSDNPAGELLIGGILGAVPDAPYVTASIDLSAQGVKVSTAVPYNTGKVAKTREFYFGPQGKGAAPALLEPAQTIFSLSAYRDFAALWRNAPDLFNDDVNGQFAAAENTLTTLFSGKSFSDDILAKLEPGVQIVVTRQDFAKNEVVPQIKLPAIAGVFRLKEPADTARQFKITYQSLVGFLNIAGGQAKLEALEQTTEKIGGITLNSAVYLPPEQAEKRKDAAVHFNASPTIAFVGDRFVIASTRALALELAQQIEKQSPKDAEGVNTQMRLDGQMLRATLTDNRQQLVAQNMAEKGHDEAAAQNEIDLLLRLLHTFQEMSLSLTTNDQLLRFNWEMKLSGK